MVEGSVYQHLLHVKKTCGGGFLLLIDPDKKPFDNALVLSEAAEACGVDAILIGSSFTLEPSFTKSTKQIKERTSLPVIIFPGSFAQINPYADAILFSSLLSGRNPNYLVDEQVKGAPLVKQCDLEPIPTGYLLIESGSTTSVQFVSNTQPLPRKKNDLVCAHALAAQYLGMKFVYLETGSGAESSVPASMTKEVAAYIDIPIIVGGGLRTPGACAEQISQGASMVVVGTSFEEKPDLSKLREMTAAVHEKKVIHNEQR